MGAIEAPTAITLHCLHRKCYIQNLDTQNKNRLCYSPIERDEKSTAKQKDETPFLHLRCRSVTAAKGGSPSAAARLGCLCQICAPARIGGNQADAMRTDLREHLPAQRAAICDKRRFHPPLDRAGDDDGHLSPAHPSS